MIRGRLAVLISWGMVRGKFAFLLRWGLVRVERWVCWSEWALLGDWRGFES